MTQIADPCDRATEQEEIVREVGIRNAALAAKKKEKTPTGKCHYCGGEVPPGAIYCDGWCREDDERLESAKRRNGY